MGPRGPGRLRHRRGHEPPLRTPGWQPQEEQLLVRQEDGTWAGFVPGVGEGTPYLYWVVGEGSQGPKRDPYARELGVWPPFPGCDCLVRSPHTYPWHDQGFRPPPFHELILYQLHVGVFSALDSRGRDVRRERRGRLLDLLERLPYLRELGVNALLLLPIQEFPTRFSLGYNGTDYFSPESDYQVVLALEG